MVATNWSNRFTPHIFVLYNIRACAISTLVFFFSAFDHRLMKLSGVAPKSTIIWSACYNSSVMPKKQLHLHDSRYYRHKNLFSVFFIVCFDGTAAFSKRFCLIITRPLMLHFESSSSKGKEVKSFLKVTEKPLDKPLFLQDPTLHQHLGRSLCLTA